MARQINQIVCVCAWLTNFHPALVPPPRSSSDTSEVYKYFEMVASDSNCESSDSDH